MEVVARAGYGARGVVYLLVGGFAAMAALELRTRTAGTRSAMQTFIDWPLGPLWLGAVACGLVGFVGWRLLQAFLDADQRGTRPLDLLFRAGQAFSALTYGALALTALDVLDGVGDIRDGEAGADPVAAVLAVPLGETLLFIGGAVTAGAAVGNFAKAVSKRFGRELVCSSTVRVWVLPLGRVGYAARGVVFVLAALLLVEIGLDLAQVRADTLGAALQQVEGLPFGSALLLVTGLSLAAFGLFGLVEARFRRIHVPEELQVDEAHDGSAS